MNLDVAPLRRSFLPRRPRKSATFVLKLTSMIDIFTILLIFLLKSFSAEGEIMTVAPDLNLPQSIAQKPPITSSIIVVTPEWLILDGKPLAKAQDILSSPKLTINSLLRELAQKKAIANQLATVNPGMAFTGTISIQGDRRIPFQLLKKVMFTCGRVGYNNMLLAVMKKEK